MVYGRKSFHSTTMVIELRFFTKKMKKMKNLENHVFLPCVTFSSNILHAVTFLHVLHLDVLRRQIEIETEISLCMAIMLHHP